MIPILGGHGPESTVTPEIQQIALDIQPALEQYLATKLINFRATHYTQQVVAGMVYHLRVVASVSTTTGNDQDGDDNEESVFHIRVFQPLPYTGEPLQLQAVKQSESTEPLRALPPKLNPYRIH